MKLLYDPCNIHNVFCLYEFHDVCIHLRFRRLIDIMKNVHRRARLSNAVCSHMVPYDVIRSQNVSAVWSGSNSEVRIMAVWRDSNGKWFSFRLTSCNAGRHIKQPSTCLLQIRVAVSLMRFSSVSDKTATKHIRLSLLLDYKWRNRNSLTVSMGFRNTPKP